MTKRTRLPAPRKADLIELMTGLGIVTRYEDKWCVTHEFKDFVRKQEEDISCVLAEYLKIEPAELMGSSLGPFLALLVAWNPSLSEGESTEAAMFLEYWATFGICPLDMYRERPGVV